MAFIYTWVCSHFSRLPFKGHLFLKSKLLGLKSGVVTLYNITLNGPESWPLSSSFLFPTWHCTNARCRLQLGDFTQDWLRWASKEDRGVYPSRKGSAGRLDDSWLSHRIIGWYGLKGTSKFQPTCHGQGCQPLNSPLVQVAQGPIQSGLEHVWGCSCPHVLLSEDIFRAWCPG